MSNKFHGDVRPLSHDPAYMDVVFEGPIDEAIAQAKAAPDHGLAPVSNVAASWALAHQVSGNRLALLQHLNLAPR